MKDYKVLNIVLIVLCFFLAGMNVFYKIKNINLEKGISKLEYQNNYYNKIILIKDKFEDKLLKYVIDVESLDIDNLITRYVNKDYFLLFIIDSVACFKCLYHHCNKIKNLTNDITTFIYSPNYGHLLKSEIPGSIVLPALSADIFFGNDPILKHFNIFLLLISKKGRIIQFEIIDPKFPQEKFSIYNRIEKY